MAKIPIKYSNNASSGYTLDGDALQVTEVTLTAAQIKALNASPVTLIPAAGVGRTILVHQIAGKSVGDTAAFTGANALEFRYTNGSGVKVSADLPASFINAADGATVLGAVSSVATAIVPVANAPVVAYVPTANPGGATAVGTITLKIWYSIFDA